MKQLSPEQRDLVTLLVKRLGAIPGVRAVVLGGSYARGRARPGSDIDLGIVYSETSPFSVQSVRELAEAVNDVAEPVVTDFYQWGPWVNGGAWLTIDGQRVDFIYRNFEQMQRVIAEAEAGRYELHYLQQPPFGFFSGTYLGEIAVCVPLFDPDAWIAGLKRRVAEYPEALRQSLIQDFLFMAEFTITAFAPKYAARSDAFGTAACLARAVNELSIVLFALNRRYLLNDKTALEEVAEFARAPEAFGPRVRETLGNLGDSAAELLAAVERIAQLLQETIALTNGQYQPRYTLPG
jgi:predicted nucleotidyltransferase